MSTVNNNNSNCSSIKLIDAPDSISVDDSVVRQNNNKYTNKQQIYKQTTDIQTTTNILTNNKYTNKQQIYKQTTNIQTTTNIKTTTDIQTNNKYTNKQQIYKQTTIWEFE